MQKFDCLTVGATIIDANMSIHDANTHVSLDEGKSELHVRYGEKIQVDECQFMLGGNACNVAVGLSRLGLKTAIMAETGDDEFALKITNGLARENVSRIFLKQTKNASASFSIGIQFKGERTLFVSHTKRKHDFQFNDVSTSWIYLTSLGEDWELAYQRTLEFVKENGVQLAFNPGSPQFKTGPESFLDVLKLAKVLIVNKEEAQKIVKKEENDMSKLIVQLQSFGPNIVSITDGSNGSFTADGEVVYRLGIFPVETIAKTGAGDAYASGFLAALMQNLPTKEAMRWGAMNAASVIQEVGAQTGLLKREELEAKLHEHPEFIAK